MKIEKIDINEIIPYKNNPREIPVESVQKVMKSIKEFGNNQPIVVDNDNVIVVGHTRWKALKNLGEKEAYIIKKEFKKSDAIAYRIMDNRSGEESKWDNKLLASELSILKEENFDIEIPKVEKSIHKPRILILYGSLREKSFSRLLAEEAGRILEYMGAEVKFFDPSGLPIYDYNKSIYLFTIFFIIQ